MFKNVLVLSASVGAGHVRAGQAVEKAYQVYGGAERVKHIDTLDFTSQMFRTLYAKTYIDMIRHAPTVLGWLYDRLDEPFKNEKFVHLFNKLNTTKLVKMIHEQKPDMLICTHFLPSEIISRLKEKGEISTPMAIVVTDLDVHAMWLCRRYDRYFVAMEETRVHLEKLGVPAEKITVTGIPIDPVFAQEKDAGAMRKKHGLKADATTILLSAGGFGVGPIEQMITALMELKHKAQVIAVCGKNAELKERLEKAVAAHAAGKKGGMVDVKVLGFTTEMDELMAASDLLVGKPGGLTTSEALARGLALVIVNPIPGQEERNSDHYLEEGVAIRCNNPQTMTFKIDRLLDDRAGLSAMRARARKLSKPLAGKRIVETLAKA